MLKHGRPFTRDRYLIITLNYGAELPEPWMALHEDEVPPPLQDWSTVKLT